MVNEKDERILMDSKEDINEKLKVMLLALGIGILFNYFFIWDSIGISGVIFNAVVIGGAIWTIYPKSNINKKLSWIFLIPIAFLSLTYCIYNNEVLRYINTILIPLLIVSYVIVIRYENIKDINLYFLEMIFSRIFYLSFALTPKFFDAIKAMINSRKSPKENSTKKNILKGLLISVPLLFVIVGLLTSADMMFKYYVENIGNIFLNLNIWSFIGHTIIIMTVTLYMFGFLWSFKYEEKKYKHIEESKASVNWEPVTIITILFVICIVYLLFSIIQFSYLYGGGTSALPKGFSHSEYARKGFFELILVTLINFTILLLSMKLCNKSNVKINKIANISYSLLIIFTFNMLFSANYKMNLYEKAFGYTRLRIFVHVFMLLLGVLLIIVLIGIWNKKIHILKCAVIASSIIYIALNFMNVDKIIARNNIARYNETKKIDIGYIETLSYDAAPEVIKLLDVDDVRIRSEIEEYIKYEKSLIKNSNDHWYEFNYYKKDFLTLKVSH
ncbi:DUF4153 domain-containing protein [Clostridium ganghwense]|uniref:DUF4173 domain-containing protein n=1 Tax=Clostridium ganghwense TaxID=312089 RepID=A0ABT4CSR6_9CLOT|nr:DUF4173 domain-containing protein [Clostridium ganghwense]MCY6371101.1 DUF4173 domain-containing protein [Clostridium ganghwense]